MVGHADGAQMAPGTAPWSGTQTAPRAARWHCPGSHPDHLNLLT